MASPFLYSLIASSTRFSLRAASACFSIRDTVAGAVACGLASADRREAKSAHARHASHDLARTLMDWSGVNLPYRPRPAGLPVREPAAQPSIAARSRVRGCRLPYA